MLIIDQKKRSGNSEVDEYITELENSWLTFEASNIKKLIISCDHVAGILADDILLLPKLGDDEDETKLQMLGSRKNKHFIAFKNVIADIKHFKTISDLLEEMKPKLHVPEAKVPEKALKQEIIEEKTTIRKNISDIALGKKQ